MTTFLLNYLLIHIESVKSDFFFFFLLTLSFLLNQEIYEKPMASPIPVTVLSPSQRCDAGAMCIDPVSPHPSPKSSSAANHKPRMRWTPELHESFLNSVNKLEGPESEF